MTAGLTLMHALVLGFSAWMVAAKPDLLLPWLSVTTNFAAVIYWATRERETSR